MLEAHWRSGSLATVLTISCVTVLENTTRARVDNAPPALNRCRRWPRLGLALLSCSQAASRRISVTMRQNGLTQGRLGLVNVPCVDEIALPPPKGRRIWNGPVKEP